MIELALAFCVYLIAGVAVVAAVVMFDGEYDGRWLVRPHWLSVFLLIIWLPLAVLWLICVIGEFCTGVTRKLRVAASKRHAAR